MKRKKWTIVATTVALILLLLAPVVIQSLAVSRENARRRRAVAKNIGLSMLQYQMDGPPLLREVQPGGKVKVYEYHSGTRVYLKMEPLPLTQ